MPPYRQRNSHGGGGAILWPPHPRRRSPTTGRLASLTHKWIPSQKSGDSFGNQLLSHSKTTQSPIYLPDNTIWQAPRQQCCRGTRQTPGQSDHVGQRSCWTPRCPVHPYQTPKPSPEITLATHSGATAGPQKLAHTRSNSGTRCGRCSQCGPAPKPGPKIYIYICIHMCAKMLA